MTSPETPASKIVVDSDVVDAWRAEIGAINRQIADLEARKGVVGQRIAAAETLFGLLSGQPIVSDLRGPSGRRYGRTTFVEMVASIIQAEGMISAPEVRRKVEESELGDRLAESDKGFYHALSRLAERGAIVRYKGWLFTPEAYEAHKKAVDEGAPDVEEATNRKSPMADEIAAFVQLRGKAKSAEIVAHLKQLSEFADVLSANTTGAYNVMSRMVKRKELRKDGTVYMAIPTPAANETSPSDDLFHGEHR